MPCLVRGRESVLGKGQISTVKRQRLPERLSGRRPAAERTRRTRHEPQRFPAPRPVRRRTAGGDRGAQGSRAPGHHLRHPRGKHERQPLPDVPCEIRRVLHHKRRQGMLFGGRSAPASAGGMCTSPGGVLWAGLPCPSGGSTCPVEEVAVEGTRAWFRRFPRPRPGRHLRIRCLFVPLTLIGRAFPAQARAGVALANDTSFGVDGRRTTRGAGRPGGRGHQTAGRCTERIPPSAGHQGHGRAHGTGHRPTVAAPSRQACAGHGRLPRHKALLARQAGAQAAE
jgi:hypothetical protein